MDRVENQSNFATLADSFGITPETLGSVLMAIGSEPEEEVPVPSYIVDLYDRNEKGDDLTADEHSALRRGLETALEYAVGKYFDRVDSDPEKYRPIIQKTINILTEDRKEGESLDDCIARVLAPSNYIFTMSPTDKRQVPALTPEATSLLFNDSVPLWNTELTNVLYQLSTKNFKVDYMTNSASIDVNEDLHVSIEGLDTFNGLSSSPLKLLDAIFAYFTYNNTSKSTGDGIQTTVEIPLKEYAQVRGIDWTPKNYPDPEVQKREQRKRSNVKYNFKKDVKRDLNSLDKFRISGSVKKGGAKGDYKNLVLIYPDHSINNNSIQVTIPDDTAEYLIKSNYITPYDPELQRLDDRNPNLYRIARKISLQHGNRQNQKAGTANTLKVSTLIDSTPYIPDLDTLSRRGSRNWKEKIKQPLEETLNDLKKSGFLASWTYRDPKAKKTYSPRSADKLTPNAYINLTVLFTLRKDDEKKISYEVGTDGLTW